MDEAITSALQRILPRIHSYLENKSATGSTQPFKLLLSGLQGSGKSTWASALAARLRTQHGLKVVVVSLDDFYHTHEALVQIKDANAGNGMLRTRGQPGTHDEALALAFFRSFTGADVIKVPAFDKSLYDGQGDRVPVSEWLEIPAVPAVDVLLFEGWCVGFTALAAGELACRWQACAAAGAPGATADGYCTTTLREHALEHVQAINGNLQRYNDTFMSPVHFQYLIHLDTEDLANAYRWRIGQEHALWQSKGRGMTDEAVVRFVRGYMPAYELYLDRLKTTPFIPHAPSTTSQLRVVLDVQRRVVDMVEL